jgi:hypothetical protein
MYSCTEIEVEIYDLISMYLSNHSLNQNSSSAEFE